LDVTFDLVLHGTWIKQESDSSGLFLIWGEQRLSELPKKSRKQSVKIPAHPYAVSSVILKDVISIH